MVSTLLFLAAAFAADPIRLPVRVHVVASHDPTMDATAVADRAFLDQHFEEINRAFAPAGIVWEIESVVVDRPHAEAAFQAATTDRSERRVALRAIRSGPGRLGAEGFDLYVVRHLSPLGIGGAYQCGSGEPAGAGAAFVAAHTSRGTPLPVRKWSHELGHALGLSHTPCDTSTRDRLMMSGKCEHAEEGRVGFTAHEVARMRAQAAVGHAAPCTKRKGRDK